METKTEERSRPYEERVEVIGRLTRELLNSELLKVLVERERQIGDGGPGPDARRKAPKWLHDLLDALWDFFVG